MVKVKKILGNKFLLGFIVVFLIGLLSSRMLFGSGYFNMHDDLQIMRQLEMEKCFLDGQIPCRWVPDMGYGFGFPLFNFYPPLPYLVGEGIRLIGFDFISTAKALFGLSLVLSGISMYLLGTEFFGWLGGVVAASFYIWAPYHAVDVFVRGAMNESWALIWFPLILWTAYKLIKEKKKLFPWIVGLALGWFSLLTSHNLMVLAFGPVFGLWCLIWLIYFKAWKKIPQLLITGIWAFGLAAFFTLPAILENKFTHVKDVLVGYYDYSAHFANLSQLFLSRFWGYGPSVWLMTEDRMSFQIGHFHWGLSLIILGLIVWQIWKKKKIDHLQLATLSLIIIGWLAAFLIHPKSTPVWLILSPLRYLQFPWRFLAVVIFCFSFAVGGLVLFIPKKWRIKTFIGLSLALAIILFDWNFFKPENGKLGPLTDQKKLNGAAWELQQTAGIYDYLPISAKEAPKQPQKKLAEIVQGEGEIIDSKQGTDWAEFKTKIETENSVVRIGIFDFPIWKVLVDGQETEIFIPEDEPWGRIHINLSQGEHQVKAQFQNTPIRTMSNYLSLTSWAVLPITLIWSWKKRK